MSVNQDGISKSRLRDKKNSHAQNVSKNRHTMKNVTAHKGIYNRYVKRVIDFILAFIFFGVTLPLFVIVSAIVVIDSGFPVLYRANRGGYRNRPFKICKFRTMVQNADKIGGPTTGLNDPRVTKAGAFLRKTKLDEIPQLINILRGEMSFVGPRPEVLQYVNRFKGVEKLILQVRPGITDYSSLKFINLDEVVGSQNVDEVFETVILKQKNDLRLKYVATVSFKTDVLIFAETVRRVLARLFGALLRKSGRDAGDRTDKNTADP